MVRRYEGRVAFISENFGDSELAQRFGVTRYPAIFVDDVLVARPRDFGFFATGENAGRYTPWRDAKNHTKFQQDLVRMIDLVLSGKKEALRAERAEGGGEELATLPQFLLTDLDGKPLTREQAAGRVVVVEFWATWCPPCRSTLKWLGEIKKKHGDRVAVLALAVESQDADVRKMAGEYSREVRWAIGTPEVAQAFGDVVSVPTLFVFDTSGKTAAVFYGAPADLHQRAEQLIESLLR